MTTEQLVDYVEVYEDSEGQFRWRAMAGNNENIASSGEGYENRLHAENMARGVFPNVEFQHVDAEGNKVDV